MINHTHYLSQLKEEVVSIRRKLHQYPELSFQEYQTAETIRNILTSWGIKFENIGETGVFVDIVGDPSGRTIGLRADIDALPIQEEADVTYRSCIDGVMHACGHDGHTAMLLGATKLLSENKNKLQGTVRCIFQPGEELDGAAKDLIDKGVLENPTVECVIGMHLWPYLPLGTVGVKSGSMTASCDDFKIVVKGKGGHCARPHLGIDAINIATKLVQDIQAIPLKHTSPTQPTLVHIGKIQGGEANNVIADTVEIEGTARSFSEVTRNLIRKKIEDSCKAAESLWGATIELDYIIGAPAINNSSEITAVFKAIATDMLGDSSVYELEEPSMGADDFGYFSEKIPSLYFRLGIKKDDEEIFDLHHPQFYFDDSVLIRGVELYTNIAEELLKRRE